MTVLSAHQVPRRQVTTLAFMPQLPGTSLLVLALMNLTLEGRGSLILTLSARVVPSSVILMVEV